MAQNDTMTQNKINIRRSSIGIRLRPSSQLRELYRQQKHILLLEGDDKQCAIPNLPQLIKPQPSITTATRVAQSLVQPSFLIPFLEFIKAIKEQFSIKYVRENLVQAKVLFEGVYSNDVAKFNGLKIDQSTKDIYVGAFVDGKKKGQGMQLYLSIGEQNMSIFKGEWSDDLPNGKGMLLSGETGMIIGGPFKDGLPDKGGGDFKLRYSNGDVYEGLMQNLKKHGSGRLFYDNGDVYEGEWVSEKREGKGKMFIKNENITVEGMFANDSIVSGKLTDKDGNVFVTDEDRGGFLDGKLQGNVIVRYACGDTFEGEFKNGKKCGYGVHQYKDLFQPGKLPQVKTEQGKGKRIRKTSIEVVEEVKENGIYEGNWKRDMREGQGTMTWADGSEFSGEWKLDQRFKGSMRMSDGTTYEGHFINDQFHDTNGRIFIKVGGRQVIKTFEGNFIHGITPKEGKITYSDGSNGIYLGEHKDFEKQGYGYLFYANGAKFEGLFFEDQMEGVGIILQPNGDYYYGQWSQNKEQGFGRQFIASTNTLYEGQWEKGMKHGEGSLIDPANGTLLRGVWRQGKLDGKTSITEIGGQIDPAKIKETPFDQIQAQYLEFRGVRSIQEAFRIPERLRQLL